MDGQGLLTTSMVLKLVGLGGVLGLGGYLVVCFFVLGTWLEPSIRGKSCLSASLPRWLAVMVCVSAVTLSALGLGDGFLAAAEWIAMLAGLAAGVGLGGRIRSPGPVVSKTTIIIDVSTVAVQSLLIALGYRYAIRPLAVVSPQMQGWAGVLVVSVVSYFLRWRPISGGNMPVTS